jgi:hypothetical protein
MKKMSKLVKITIDEKELKNRLEDLTSDCVYDKDLINKFVGNILADNKFMDWLDEIVEENIKEELDNARVLYEQEMELLEDYDDEDDYEDDDYDYFKEKQQTDDYDEDDLIELKRGRK